MTTNAAFSVGLTEAAKIFNTGPTEERMSLRSPCATVNEFIAIMNSAVNCRDASMHNQESMEMQVLGVQRGCSHLVFNHVQPE